MPRCNCGNECQQELGMRSNEVGGIWCAHDNMETANDVVSLLLAPFRNKNNKKIYFFSKTSQSWQFGELGPWCDGKHDSVASGQGIPAFWKLTLKMQWDMVIKPFVIEASHDNLRGRVLDNSFWQERPCFSTWVFSQVWAPLQSLWLKISL